MADIVTNDPQMICLNNYYCHPQDSHDDHEEAEEGTIVEQRNLLLTTLPPTTRCRSAAAQQAGHNASTSNTAVMTEVDKKRTPRQQLRDWKFDPYDVSKSSTEWCTSPSLYLESSASLYHYIARDNHRSSRPMILFTQLGDISMMEYILANSTLPNPLDELSKTDEFELFPQFVCYQIRILILARNLSQNDHLLNFLFMRSISFECLSI